MARSDDFVMNSHASILQSIAIFIQCIIVFLATIYSSWTEAVALSQLYIIAQCFGFFAILLDNRRGGISYMIEFFLLFFIALPALLQVGKRTFPWFAALQPIHICSAFGILAISHIALHLGFILRSKYKSKPQANTHENLDNKKAVFYSRWAWSIAVVSTLFAVIAGPSNLLVARFELADADLGGMSLQFLFMCRSLSLLAMVMLIFLIKNTTSKVIKRQNVYALLMFIPIFLIINYLPALPRFILFGIFIALSTLFINYFSPKIKVLVAVASVLILFVVFPTIKSLGEGELDTTGLAQRTDTGTIGNYLMRVDFDAFMQITSTVQYYSTDVGPIRYGENFLGVALFFVPRAIWHSKPIDTGEIVSTGLGFLYTNVSSPLPAEALMGFGLMGPTLVFFALAWFVSGIEEQANSLIRVSPKASSFFLYAITMGFIVIIMRGALNGVAPQFATAFLVFLIMQFFKNKKVVVNGIRN
jgi:hypothetical protein